MTSEQILTAVKTRAAGWQNALHRYGSRLDPHEKWLVGILATNPPGPADSVESLTGTTFALSLDKIISDIVTTGAATATLADGYEGQLKTVFLRTDGGELVLTPANLRGGDTITFSEVDDFVVLQFVAGQWTVVVNSNTVVA